MQGAILVLSGPSGSGKSSLCKHLFEVVPACYFSISTTTRPMREGEVDGKHYHFVTKEAFESGIQDDLFLEWAEVHGNYYGTSKASVEEALQQDRLVVFDIDVQGHANVKKQFPALTTSVFITTPNRTILRERLENRGSDSQEVIEGRLERAHDEMEHIGEYDYLLINDDLEDSQKKLVTIAKSALLKSTLIPVSAVVEHWNH